MSIFATDCIRIWQSIWTSWLSVRYWMAQHHEKIVAITSSIESPAAESALHARLVRIGIGRILCECHECLSLIVPVSKLLLSHWYRLCLLLWWLFVVYLHEHSNLQGGSPLLLVWFISGSACSLLPFASLVFIGLKADMTITMLQHNQLKN